MTRAASARLARALKLALLTALGALWLAPVAVIVMNSFKGKLSISAQPFALPNANTFAGLANYLSGIEKTGFPRAFGLSLYITALSVAALLLLCSMTGWYVARVSTRGARTLYFLLIFSMVVPFQMVMFTMSFVANLLRLDNPTGIVAIYTGFGAGLSVFLFAGFAQGVPIEIEEAAFMDGCGAIRAFFSIVLPVLRPTAVTVAILQAMWIWNDYLLPYLLLGSSYRTIPIAVQYLRGGYGAVDMGAMMAVLVLAILPIVAFYLLGQRAIIGGVLAGAVKG